MAALDEHYGEALKGGDATRAEMFAVAMLLVGDRIRSAENK